MISFAPVELTGSHPSLESESRECGKALKQIKGQLVHPDYDSKAIYSAACRQINRLGNTTYDMHACSAAVDHPPLAEWISASATEAASGFYKILWINSASRGDLTVSRIVVEAINKLKRTWQDACQPKETETALPLILHCMHQTEHLTLPATNTDRTASTLLSEAIYQLLT